MNTPAPSGYRLGYRSDIEGLRAVAILLVVAAHARIPGFVGGFVGVDMFFVLSGYLITGLLVQEIERSGTVKFAAFYARRFRRLLPGLLVMLAAAALFANFVVAPEEQPEQASGAGSAAMWLSNFYFAFERLDYFSPGSETNPFLHTWSLGVEEQFYLVWPMLLVMATGAWVGARKQPQLHRVRNVMPAIFIASLAACAVWASIDPMLSFYMMPSRAWQFAIGAMVFTYFGSPEHAPGATARGSYRNALLFGAGWLGLAAAIVSAMALGPDVTYPWPWALLPSLAAAAILACGATSPRIGVGAFLSLRPLHAIGRVSYSWYLWHWPVLLLGGIFIDTQILTVRLGLALLSLIFAALAYHLIETPIRRQPFAVQFPRAAIATALILLISGGFIGAQWREAALSRVQRPHEEHYVDLIYGSPIVYSMDCDDWFGSAAVKPCTFGATHAAHTAVIIGDSVAMQWFPAVAKIFGEPDWRLVAFTKSACPMVDAPVFYARIRREYTECARWRADALRQVAALAPDVVLLGSTDAYRLTPADWREGTKRVLASISAGARHIYILRATPRLPFNPRVCLAPRGGATQALSAAIDCRADARAPEGDAVFGWISQAASDFQNVAVIDLTDAVCPHEICDAERDGTIVFRDFEHLTTGFVTSLTDVLRKALIDAGAPLSAVATEGHAEAASIMPKSPP